jgi:hypothetical protein
LDKPLRRARAGGFPEIRELIGAQRYLLTEKAYDLLSQGYFELEDLEHSIEHGTLIKTEKDEIEDSIGNKKYTIIGPDTAGYPFYTVGKIQKVGRSKKYLVITAHEAEATYE